MRRFRDRAWRFVAVAMSVGLLGACGGSDSDVQALRKEVQDLRAQLAASPASTPAAEVVTPTPSPAPISLPIAATPRYVKAGGNGTVGRSTSCINDTGDAAILPEGHQVLMTATGVGDCAGWVVVMNGPDSLWVKPDFLSPDSPSVAVATAAQGSPSPGAPTAKVGAGVTSSAGGSSPLMVAIVHAGGLFREPECGSGPVRIAAYGPEGVAGATRQVAVCIEIATAVGAPLTLRAGESVDVLFHSDGGTWSMKLNALQRGYIIVPVKFTPPVPDGTVGTWTVAVRMVSDRLGVGPWSNAVSFTVLNCLKSIICPNGD